MVEKGEDINLGSLTPDQVGLISGAMSEVSSQIGGARDRADELG
jgi:hypothetical protein